MKVDETPFFTLQGEGINVGRPAVLLKLQKSGKKIDLNVLAEEIKGYPCDRLVITGEEPLLQQDEVRRLIGMLPDYRIEVETGGIFFPEWANFGVLFSVSPKQSSYKRDVLAGFNKVVSVFKFTIADKKDFRWMMKVMAECGISRKKVVVMPDGETQKEISESILNIMDDVKEEGLRLIPKLKLPLEKPLKM